MKGIRIAIDGGAQWMVFDPKLGSYHLANGPETVRIFSAIDDDRINFDDLFDGISFFRLVTNV